MTILNDRRKDTLQASQELLLTKLRTRKNHLYLNLIRRIWWTLSLWALKTNLAGRTELPPITRTTPKPNIWVWKIKIYSEPHKSLQRESQQRESTFQQTSRASSPTSALIPNWLVRTIRRAMTILTSTIGSRRRPRDSQVRTRWGPLPLSTWVSTRNSKDSTTCRVATYWAGPWARAHSA